MSRVVAGTLLLPNGQPMANASIYFTAKRTEPVSIIEGSNTFFNTSSAGVYNQSVVNGFYAVSIEYIADASGAYTRRWQLGDVFIENGAATTLEALLIASNVPDDVALGVFYEILEEAQAAAASASASAAAAAASAASITVGTAPTNIPNNTILNTRLGTAENLGTAAQQDIGDFASAAQGAKADSAIQTATLNTRLGTTENLGTAAQANSTNSSTDESPGRLRRTGDSPGYSKANNFTGANTFAMALSASTLISTVSGAAYDVSSAAGSGNGIPDGYALHDAGSWVNKPPLFSGAMATYRVSANRQFQFGANAGSDFYGRALHSSIAGSFAKFFTNVNQLDIGLTAASARAAIDSSILPPFTVATVPSAAANPNKLIVVTNAAAGRNSYLSDGTNWRDPARVVLS